jgi:PAS domain-containing protein
VIVTILWAWPGSREAAPSRQLAAAETGPPASRFDYDEDIKPLFAKYCSDCHSEDYAEGEVAFDRYQTLDDLHNDRLTWVKVHKLLKVEAMPPPGDADLPTDPERQKLVDWLDYQLYYVDCSQPPNPGRVTVRRLNRNEYNNTVRDLLGVDFQPADDFPSDDTGYGFDNIGDVLSVPPLLIEKYLDAAEQIAERAIPLNHPEYGRKRFNASDLQGKGGGIRPGRNNSKAILSNGKVFSEFHFKGQGKYVIRIEAEQDKAGDEHAKMEVRIGDDLIDTVDVKGNREPYDVELTTRVEKTGKREISAAFTNDYYKPEKKEDRNLYVRYIEIEGPIGIPEEVRESRPLIRAVPGDGVSVADAARENLQDFLPRAFRRPVTDEEIAKYAGLVEMAVEHEEPFEGGMRLALQAVLVSPEFLFRAETGRQHRDDYEMLDDFALASRLSYFLWSSMPDAELFQVAREGRLHQPEVLEAQTRRMLQDPKTDALIEHFAGQWLGLRTLATADVEPDRELFPDFTDGIRDAMWKETELFFGAIVRDDRSIYDLLDGRYTFLNQQLAELYGIDGVEGDEFQEVSLEGTNRAGVLTHGSILTLTSYPNRTSPVQRGQWVLENLLGDAPPEAPPVVPGLEETQEANPDLSFREQLELHRSDPGCASCHKLMDDLGFGLENFDAIGRWRTQDGEHPIDSSGILPTGEKFDGPLEMIGILRNRKEQFGRCLTEKLLTYALGRGVEYYDKCAVDQILHDLERDESFSALVLGIVRSAPFQMRKIDEKAAE